MRVLIVKLSSLGDVIHAMPTVADILRIHPGASIDWVVESAFAPLLRRVDGLDQVIEISLRRWRKAWWRQSVRAEWRAFRRRLGRERYDSVIDLQGLTKSALVARLAQGTRYGLANRTEGSSHEWPARWLVDRAIRVESRSHAVDRSRELVGRALGAMPVGPPCYRLRSPAGAGAAPKVVFVHGTTRDDKLWPEAHWIALGRLLVAEGVQIALPRVGDIEHRRAQAIAASIGREGVVWPEMPLDQLLDAMASSQGVIGVDSGLSHLAVALDLPHVQIYNLPTAWRTGPQTRAGGAPHQVAVVDQPTPSVETVIAAWRAACRARPESV